MLDCIFRQCAVLIICLIPYQVSAEFNTDTVRDALDQEDFATLDRLFTLADAQALQDQDFAAFDAVYGTLYSAINFERLSTTQRWQDAYPNSPYPHVALAWSHYNIAFQNRGGGYLSDISTTSHQLFREHMAMAQNHAVKALETGPNFQPAVKVRISLTPHFNQRDLIPNLVAHGFDLTPDYDFLDYAVPALSLAWGGTWEQNDGLCRQFGHRIPNGTYDLCMMRVVFDNQITGDWRGYALNILDASDDPAYDGYRLNAYIAEWSNRPQAQSEAIRLHAATLGPRTIIALYNWRLNQINTLWRGNDYGYQARIDLGDMVLDRLLDSPDNINLLREAVRIHDRGVRWTTLDDPQAQAAFGYWLRMVEIAGHRPEMWELGYILIERSEDVTTSDAVHHAITNHIYYSSFDLATFNTYYDRIMFGFNTHFMIDDYTFRPPDDDTTLNEQVLCPALQARRVYNDICSGLFQPRGCQDDLDFGDNLGLVAALSTEPGRCPVIAGAAASDLYYSPVPIETFRDLLLTED